MNNTIIKINMDKVFWDLIRSGNKTAFTKLYNDHADFLFAYGSKINSDYDTVTEAIQDLFVYLYEKKEKLSYPESTKAYLCIALKRILIRTSNKKRSVIIFSLDNTDQPEYNFNIDIDIESAIIRDEEKKETLEKLQIALEKLSPQQREVIYLKYYKECTNDEVALILGVSNQIVRNIASRALIRLRKFGEIRTLCINDEVQL